MLFVTKAKKDFRELDFPMEEAAVRSISQFLNVLNELAFFVVMQRRKKRVVVGQVVFTSERDKLCCFR